ncbi:N-acetyl sugar amidotransferase [Amylibacter sp.]|nr:N-acetyl sugar amidotransferase [Amylibacter sp.]
MKICQKCLYTSLHPFGLEFKDNVCSGCFTHQEKYEINWELQLSKLQELIRNNKRQKRSYDCVVPVIGDAEDYFVLNTILKLGLNPLVTSVNDYFRNDIGWYNLHNLITYFDVDSIQYSPDLQTYKNLVSASLRKYNHILLPFLQLHTAFPVHVAKDRKIPLIIWGQNQAVEQVGKFSHLDEVQMTSWSRTEHDLMNTNINTLIGTGVATNEHKLNYYKYPDIKSLNRMSLRGIYLSNYFMWDPLRQNNSAKQYGFKPEAHSSSFDIYERAGSSVYYNFHDLLKLKRCGYQKVLDQTCREIRHQRISRKAGQKIVEKFGENKFYIKEFFDWLGTTDTGYSWFKEKRLHNLKNRITDIKSEQNFNSPKVGFEELLTGGDIAEKGYIIYGKGI